jgi:hypothetical protein
MKTNDEVHPVDPTQTTEAAPSAHRGRKGKIARLPLAIRQELDQRLQNGEQGRKLVEWLNGLPEVQAVMAAEFHGSPIREQSLSEWRKRGYKISLEERQMREDVKSLLNEIGGLKVVAKEGLTDQLAFLLAVHMAIKLKRLDSVTDPLERAKALRELNAGLVALRRGDLELERLRLQRERCGLRQKTQQEREEEFWKWADENINRDEFCRRRCFTAAEREAAMDKILGLTPEERGETIPQPADAPAVEDDPAKSEQIRVNPSKSE